MKIKKKVNVRVPRELKKKITRLARRNGLSLNQFLHLGICERLRELEAGRAGFNEALERDCPDE